MDLASWEAGLTARLDLAIPRDHARIIADAIREAVRLRRAGVLEREAAIDDQIDKPSIAYWRDHSAGASRRRVTPMPRGNRPSDGSQENHVRFFIHLRMDCRTVCGGIDDS
jgi:hypothetical protein